MRNLRLPDQFAQTINPPAKSKLIRAVLIGHVSLERCQISVAGQLLEAHFVPPLPPPGTIVWVLIDLDRMLVLGPCSITPTPTARVYLTAAESITNNTQTVPGWDNDIFDRFNLWNPSVPGRFTIPGGLGGLYHVGYTVAWPPNATGVRSAWLRKNGDGNHRTAQQHIAGSVDLVFGNSTIWQLVDGDYVEAVVYQTSGGNLNLVGDNVNQEGASSFWIYRVGD